MKRFLSKIGLLVLVVLAIMTVADIAYTYVYVHTPPREKTKYIVQLKDKKIDYIFLGSSRVRNTIVTKMIEDATGKTALNLGIDGAKIDDILLQLKLLVHNNVKFEKVFIQIDYMYNGLGPSDIVGSQSLPYLRKNQVIAEQMKTHHPKFLPYYYVPFYRYLDNDYAIGFRMMLLNIIDRRKTDFADGFEPRSDEFANIGQPLPDHIVARNEAFDQMQAYCKANHIDVIYFAAPYCDDMASNPFHAMLRRRIPELHDYSAAITDKKYFRDCRHLKTSGAEVFTQMIVNDFLTPKSAK